MTSSPRPSPAQFAEVRAALAGEPDRADLERVWLALGDAAPDAPALDAAWDALRARLGPPAEAHAAAGRPVSGNPASGSPASRNPAPGRRVSDRAAARPKRRLWLAGALATAAALAVVTLVTTVALSQWGAAEVAHTAPAGATLAVALPDGSTAVLNSGATLRHARRFSGTRAVALRGEAFFDVTHDASAPFVVVTRAARVEVLGTAFNVRDAGTATTVALVRGSVRVTAAAAPAGPALRAATLAPGEALTVGPAGVGAPAAADVERAAAWRTGALAFDGLALGDILGEVERRYGVAVAAAPGTPLGARVSAYYTARPPIETLLGDIGTAAGVRFTPTAAGYTVRPAARAPRGGTSAAARAAR